MMSGLLIPSYHQGFAHFAAEAEDFALREACIGLWAPCLGWTGTTAHDWGTCRHRGTLVNGVSRAMNKYGGAWSFDGGDDHVNLGQALNFERTEHFAVEVLLEISAALAAFHVFVAKQDSDATKRGWVMRTGQAGVREHLRWQLTTDAGAGKALVLESSNAVFSAAGEYHICVTYDGSSIPGGVVAYVNGVAVAMGTTTDTLDGTILNSAPAGIGARVEDDAGNFSGEITLCAAYNRVLTPAEVRRRAIDPLGILRLREEVVPAVAAAGSLLLMQANKRGNKGRKCGHKQAA